MKLAGLLIPVLGVLCSPAIADNTDPNKHPEQYKKFVERLDAMQKDQSSDYYGPMEIVFLTTQDTLAGAKWMQKASDEGHPVAQLFVSNSLFVNEFLVDDFEKRKKEIFELTKKAAQSDYIPAKIKYAFCVSSGLGVKADPIEGERLLMAACKDGHFLARFHWLKQSGRLETYVDLERPEVQSEIKRGNYYVSLAASDLYVNKKATSRLNRYVDADKYLEYLKLAASQNSSEALFILAHSLPPKESMVVLRRAIELHNPRGMHMMGTIFIDPSIGGKQAKEIGLKQDFAKGAFLIKMASMLRNARSHFLLAKNYHDGLFHSPKDIERAREHFRLGTELMDIPCALGYSQLLLQDDSAESHKVASRLIDFLASRNVGGGLFLKAYTQYKGIGCKANFEDACTQLLEAAAHGFPQAYVYLAYLYEKGQGDIKPDLKKSAFYKRIATPDLGEKAVNGIYEKLEKAGDWVLII